MSENGNKGLYLAVAAAVVLAIALAFFGLRLEERMDSIQSQLLDRPPTAAPLQQLDATVEQVAAGQTVYVPVYSHVFHTGGRELLLEATLSIRNTDPEQSIIINSVRYFDTAGSMVREYLKTPVVLAPRASTDFLVERRDRSGGSGANFLIDWVAEQEVNEPLIEAVMVSFEGNAAISFVRRGHAIAHVP